MIKALSTKLVNENKTYWDKHMSRWCYFHTKHYTMLQHDIHIPIGVWFATIDVN